MVSKCCRSLELTLSVYTLGADNRQLSVESLLEIIPFGIDFFFKLFLAAPEAHGMPEGYCERYSQQRTKAILEFKRQSRTPFRHVSTLLFGGFVTVGKDQAGSLAWHGLPPFARISRKAQSAVCNRELWSLELTAAFVASSKIFRACFSVTAMRSFSESQRTWDTQRTETNWFKRSLPRKTRHFMFWRSRIFSLGSRRSSQLELL